METPVETPALETAPTAPGLPVRTVPRTIVVRTDLAANFSANRCAGNQALPVNPFWCWWLASHLKITQAI